MQHPADALSLLASRLNALQIDWMLVGSVAALFYGRQRSTIDIDIVITGRGANPRQLAAALAPDWMLDEQMAADSLRHGSMFNAIPLRGGPKVDFSPLKPGSIEEAAFSHRELHDWYGTPVWLITPADLVLTKLNWAKDSMSERQLADVRAIMSTGVVDEDGYFNGWVERLGLEQALDASRTTRYDE